jgi:pyruvate/2-oxoglutarate dehydrogenase complex dihydrolipoamide dehydrogenase (E3) component
MIASAKAAWVMTNSQKLGVTAESVKVDIKTVMKRKDDIVHTMRNNSEEGVNETANLDVFYGAAAFVGPNKVIVSLNEGGSQELHADKIFINTGAKPSVPDIEGLETISYLNSTSILELTSVPEHLLIIGGGYIGLEFGQMFRRFGSEVTIILPSDRLLPKEDEDISEEMHKILALEDIAIHIKSKVTHLKKEGESIKAVVDIDGKSETIACSHVLVATGRTPQSAELALDKAGVETDDEGHIIVNTSLETSAEGVYALGDVKGGPAFTHISYDDFRIISNNILDKGNETTAGRPVPYCMFTDPQLGRIGITEQEARQQGLAIAVASIPNSAVARSIETGDERGMMKAVVDVKTGKILGASVLAEQGGEIVTILQMAMMGGVSYKDIRDTAFAHPTYAESLNNLFMTLDS